MILRKTKYLLGASILLGSSLLSPISAFAEGSGTNGLTFYDYLASKADKDTVIDFNQAPATGDETVNIRGVDIPVSDLGGLYVLQSTTSDAKPVYFYRGNVKDNNVILNDFCWLMVRTTETGGTKLLYNGAPTADGQCLGDPDWSWEDARAIIEATGQYMNEMPRTNVALSSFNANAGSPSDFGFMYGARYEAKVKNISTGMVFGNDVTYSNGVYTLKDTVTVTDEASVRASADGHHYTCLTSDVTCEEVYYSLFHPTSLLDWSRPSVLTLSRGDTIETAIQKMNNNQNNSTIKNTLENWFGRNMKGAVDYLEDAVWYSDKTYTVGELYSKDADSGSGYDNYNYSRDTERLIFSGLSRENEDAPELLITPFVSYENTDAMFTVSTETGNGKMKHPVGLLTASELTMAGANLAIIEDLDSYAKGTYVDDNSIWWTMTPYDFYRDISAHHAEPLYFDGTFGGMMWNYAQWSIGVRPSVSLKSTLGALDGDGSKDNPFRELVEVEDSEDGEDVPDEAGQTTPINPQTSDILPLAILSATVIIVASCVAIRRKTLR